MNLTFLIYLTLLTYGICYIIIDSYIFSKIKYLIIYKKEEKSVQLPRNKYIVELFNCYFCLGFWISILLQLCLQSYNNFYFILPNAIVVTTSSFLIKNIIKE